MKKMKMVGRWRSPGGLRCSVLRRKTTMTNRSVAAATRPRRDVVKERGGSSGSISTFPSVVHLPYCDFSSCRPAGSGAPALRRAPGGGGGARRARSRRDPRPSTPCTSAAERPLSYRLKARARARSVPPHLALESPRRGSSWRPTRGRDSGSVAPHGGPSRAHTVFGVQSFSDRGPCVSSAATTADDRRGP